MATLAGAGAKTGVNAVARRLSGLWRAALGGAGRPLAALSAARAQLFLWAPLGLSLGIGGYFAAGAEPGPVVWAGAVAVALAGAAFWARGPEPARFPAALLLLAACGLMLAGLRAHSVAAPVLPWRYYGPVEGRIVEIDRSGRDRIRLTLDQVVLDRMAPGATPARIRIALHGDQGHLNPVPGLRVMATAHLAPPSGPAAPGDYDFRRHAWFAGLGAVGYVRAPVLVAAPPDPDSWTLAGHRARMRLSAAIQDRIPGQPGAVAAALMTGDRSAISEATNEVMRVSNLYHIISISGLHMGMLAGFVFAALRYGLAAAGRPALHWPGKKIAALAALLAATVYLWLAGPQVATQRAYLMAAVMLLAVLVDRRAFSLRTVALAALILLVREPESLTEPGFQMSFGATVALILCYQPWARLAPRVPAVLRPVAMLVISSLAAGLATAPIAAAHFSRMSEYGLLANLLAVPVMGTLVMPAGVIAACLAPLGLAGPALWVMEQGTAWMIFVAEFVAGLGGAIMAVPAPGPTVLPLMAVGALVAVLARGAGRSLGVAAVLLAGGLWVQGQRPDLLIAPEGELVGLMGPGGRIFSRNGADFIGDSWLEADGDPARTPQAAARPGFAGPKGARQADFAGQPLIHLTGKGAIARLSAACRPGARVILAGRAPAGPVACDLWDQIRLRETGAVAIWADGRIDTATARAGGRPWTRQGPL